MPESFFAILRFFFRQFGVETEPRLLLCSISGTDLARLLRSWADPPTAENVEALRRQKALSPTVGFHWRSDDANDTAFYLLHTLWIEWPSVHRAWTPYLLPDRSFPTPALPTLALPTLALSGELSFSVPVLRFPDLRETSESLTKALFCAQRRYMVGDRSPSFMEQLRCISRAKLLFSSDREMIDHIFPILRLPPESHILRVIDSCLEWPEGWWDIFGRYSFCWKDAEAMDFLPRRIRASLMDILEHGRPTFAEARLLVHECRRAYVYLGCSAESEAVLVSSMDRFWGDVGEASYGKARDIPRKKKRKAVDRLIRAWRELRMPDHIRRCDEIRRSVGNIHKDIQLQLNVDGNGSFHRVLIFFENERDLRSKAHLLDRKLDHGEKPAGRGPGA